VPTTAPIARIAGGIRAIWGMTIGRILLRMMTWIPMTMRIELDDEVTFTGQFVAEAWGEEKGTYWGAGSYQLSIVLLISLEDVKGCLLVGFG
jgi:hypothetical protein